MKAELCGDAIVERMVALARELGTKTADPRRDRQFLASLDERVGARRKLHTRRRQFVGVLATAAAGLGLLLWLQPSRPHSLSYQVSGGGLSEGSIVGQTATSVAFSDGSRLKLTSGARARINDVTAHGAHVDLLEGEVAVDIVKADGNAWFVQAGPYQVHVVGTAFDVRWDKERRRIEVDLQRGSVVVTGPQIDGQLRLQPGQRLTSTPDHPSSITRGGAVVAAAPVSTVFDSKEPPEQGVPSDAESVADLGAGSSERRDQTTADWPHLVAQGDFQRVLQAAQRRGIDNVLSAGSQRELAAFADAARYGRNPELARRALLAERKRFAKAAAARGVAFFLGGIEADGSAAALAWYETYLAESPKGPYASQALGRRMMIVHRRGGNAASAPLAREYLQRFAQGPYASAAHKILQSSPE